MTEVSDPVGLGWVREGPGLRRRRWTREEYEQAGEAGILRPEERLELIATLERDALRAADTALAERCRSALAGDKKALAVVARALQVAAENRGRSQ